MNDPLNYRTLLKEAVNRSLSDVECLDESDFLFGVDIVECSLGKVIRSKKQNLPFSLTYTLETARISELEKKTGVRYPYQMIEIVGALAEYDENPLILPLIKTKSGRYPSQSTRAMISSVATVMFMSACMSSGLVGTFQRGKHKPMAKIELARRAGFTFITDDGNERIEPAWDRAYQLFCSTYVKSEQSRRAHISKIGTKWQRSVKALTQTFLLHITNHAFNEGLVTKKAVKSLRKQAEEKIANNLSDNPDEITEDNHEWEQSINHTDGNLKVILKRQKTRNGFIRQLIKDKVHRSAAILLGWVKYPALT